MTLLSLHQNKIFSLRFDAHLGKGKKNVGHFSLTKKSGTNDQFPQCFFSCCDNKIPSLLRVFTR